MPPEPITASFRTRNASLATGGIVRHIRCRSQQERPILAAIGNQARFRFDDKGPTP